MDKLWNSLEKYSSVLNVSCEKHDKVKTCKLLTTIECVNCSQDMDVILGIGRGLNVTHLELLEMIHKDINSQIEELKKDRAKLELKKKV